MLHPLTAAVDRAMICASGWTCSAVCDELEPTPLLVGLLAEPECRAAAMLAKLAIDIPAVRLRWPELRPIKSPLEGVSTRKPLSWEVERSMNLARQRLVEFPRPLEMATEHVLLGLAADDGELSVWLRQQGLDPDRLEAEIRGLYGYPDAFSPGVHAGQQCPIPFFAGDRAAPTISQRTAALRVLDAAANRAREGLRVLEDYVRFVLDDRHLTGLCKQFRHDLTEALGQVPLEHRLAARETQADVGTVLTTPAEQSREDAAGVLAANFARLQESLRSLEEFGKLFDGDLSATLKQLRYRTYTLHRAVDVTRAGIERLADARLYVLIDGRPSSEEFQRLARSLIDAGVHVLQLRDKRLDDRELLERARILRTLTQETDTLFVMNDRPDLAVLAHADGVHVGQEELLVKDARSIVGPETLVGVSTHTIQQARQAVLDGANYIGVGPTFPSETKQFAALAGVELLRQVAAEIRLPAFAIGGIGRENVATVLETDFTRIAVGQAVTAAADPGQAARELLKTPGHIEKTTDEHG